MGVYRDGDGLVERGFRILTAARGRRVGTHAPLGESRASDLASGAISEPSLTACPRP